MDTTGISSDRKTAWAFTRMGGVDQVLIRDGKDIEAIPGLDQKLWAALAMPKKAPGVLPATLDGLDSDKDGRIRAPDIIAAIEFCKARLSSLDAFMDPGESLDLSLLKSGEISEIAAWALASQGRPEGKDILLAEAGTALEKFDANRFNGDGVLPPESAQDGELSALVEEIAGAGYGVPDLGGATGVAASSLDAFTADAQAWLEWSAIPASNPAVMPLGDGTGKAWAALSAIRAKVDDHFIRSGLAAIAGPDAGAMWGQEQRLAAILASGIGADSAEMAELPLCPPSREGVLDLAAPVNPAWTTAMRAFAQEVAPLAGDGGTRLTADKWEEIKAIFVPYADWIAARPAGCVGASGTIANDRIAAILGGDGIPRLRALIDEDTATARRRENLADLVKLLCLRRDLVRILRNFVNFHDFYSSRDGIFQAGRLFIDARECSLVLEVDNPPAHSNLDPMSGAYLAYCDCTRKDGSRKAIVAAFTAGDADHLFPGRNGVFYDRDGLDWDARITKVTIQPISIREAFFSPYKWLVRTLEDMAAKRAAAAESANQAKMKTQAEGTVTAVSQPKPEPKPEPPRKMDVGTVAAIGVALGSIGAMVTGVLGIFLGMGIWMPLGFVSIFILISGPSMILAYIKLRKRNLGPILDAEGWAINGRLKINVPFGNTLTRMAVLPAGSERLLKDPFAQKHRPWGVYLAILAVLILAVLWAAGGFDSFLPESVTLRYLLGR